MRPTAARWFEVLTPCDELASTVEAMAATGQVQVEAERSIDRPTDEPAAELEEYRRLSRRFARFWPRPDFRARMTAGVPREIVRHAIAVIGEWAGPAEPLIERAERLEAERDELLLLAEVGSTPRGTRSPNSPPWPRPGRNSTPGCWRWSVVVPFRSCHVWSRA